MVISAYTRRKEKRKPVTQAFSCLKDCTYKEGSKNMAQGKSVKLSIAQDRQCDKQVVPTFEGDCFYHLNKNRLKAKSKSRTQATPDSNNKSETVCYYVLCGSSVDGHPVRREFMTLDHIYLTIEKSFLWAWISNKRLTIQQFCCIVVIRKR